MSYFPEEKGTIEESFESLINNLPAVVYRGYPDWGVTFMGKGVKEITGYGASEFTEGTVIWRDIILEEDLETVIKAFREAVSAKKDHLVLEYRFLHRDGSVKWAEDRRKFTYDDQGLFLHVDGLLFDVTSKREMQNALVRSELRYRSLIENINLGFSIIDEDHNVVLLNSFHAGMFDKAQEEIVGKKCYREFEKRDHVCPHCPGVSAMATGKPAEVETTGVRDDGSTLNVRIRAFPYVDDSGEAKGFIEVVENISELRAAETSLNEAKEKLTALVNASPLGIMALSVDGLLTMWNPSAERIFGYTREDVLGKPIPVVSDEEMEKHLEFRKQILYMRNLDGIELRRSKKDGTPVDIKFWAAPTRNQKGDVDGMMVIVADVTELKALENQFQQAQKMESVGRLAGGIAHDINNYLGAITGFCEIVKLKCQQDRVDLSEMIRNIDSAIDTSFRASSLIKQLLAFSRKQPARPKPINVNDVIGSMGKMMERIIGEDVVLERQTAEDMGNIMIDPGQLEQILVNLLVNARDAMPAGGKIIISTSKEVVKGPFMSTMPVMKPGTYVLLSISDTGTGMGHEIQKNIFDPFFTTKGRGEGSGLGLSTVYGIVKQNGGHIFVTSEEGRGSTFKIFFPCCEGDILESVPAANEVETMNYGTETLLLVEDNENIRNSTKAVLETLGYRVITAGTGEDGIRELEKALCEIDLIITDVVLPGLSGREMVMEIRKKRGEIKALYISGYSGDAISKHGILYDDVDFIEKPFSAQDLSARIREVLG